MVSSGSDAAWLSYLEPWLGRTTAADWAAYTVLDPNIKVQVTFPEMLDYYTSLGLETYQILDAHLVANDGTRRTQMRLHEMVRSTWAIEAGPGIELRRLGIHQIENEDAQETIEKEFALAISQGRLDPDALRTSIRGQGRLSPYWRDNPFNGTAVNVAGDERRVVLHLIREASEPDFRVGMHMYCLLDAPLPDPNDPAQQDEGELDDDEDWVMDFDLPGGDSDSSEDDEAIIS